MEFNRYIWDLYKNSKEGQTYIEYYRDLNDTKIQELKQKYEFVTKVGFYKDAKSKEIVHTKNLIEIVKNFKINNQIKNINQAVNYFFELINDGIPIKNPFSENAKLFGENGQHLQYDLIFVAPVSIGLYLKSPDYFFPLFETYDFIKIINLIKGFNLNLPEIPGKLDFLNRIKYYGKLCKLFYNFRTNNNLSPEELCAFLYDFGPNVVEKKFDENLPEPSKVWFIGGGINDNGDIEFLNEEITGQTIAGWQGNIDTRRGDIIVMYCLKPMSAIHSIWRAYSEGYNNPFFGFYNMIKIFKPIRVKQISYQELAHNKVFAKNALIRRRMQGINGVPIKIHEYNELLTILQSKGQDISALPRLSRIENISTEHLKNEKDVESNLIEPFLKRLEYERVDWQRQIPVKMGSGYSYFPDYAIGANMTKGNEKAKYIIEAKYSIHNTKKLYKDYYQAKSYAVQLNTLGFALAAKEGIWLYFHDGNNDYDFERNLFHNWKELENPDIFHNVLLKIGRNKILK